MLDILLRHHQVVFLAERAGVLQICAEHLKRRLETADVFAVMRSPINSVLQNEAFGTPEVRFKPLTSGEAAQEERSLGGAKWREGYRATA
jgi:hypothetical protein